MSKRKKKATRPDPKKVLDLATAITSLITALVLLYEKLTS